MLIYVYIKVCFIDSPFINQVNDYRIQYPVVLYLGHIKEWQQTVQWQVHLEEKLWRSNWVLNMCTVIRNLFTPHFIYYLQNADHPALPLFLFLCRTLQIKKNCGLCSNLPVFFFGKTLKIQCFKSKWYFGKSVKILHFFTNKTDCHNITEILWKVALNTITLTLLHFYCLLL